MGPSKSASTLKRSHPYADSQSQQTTSPTSLLSTSSPVAGREIFGHQRDLDARTFYAGNAAHTQYGVAETIGPELQRSPASRSPAYPATIERDDLQSGGSRTSGKSSMQPMPRIASMEDAILCPYHRSIFQDPHTNTRPGQGLGPMDRYVAEGPSERYVILHRPNDGNMSTRSGCRCLELMQSRHN